MAIREKAGTCKSRFMKAGLSYGILSKLELVLKGGMSSLKVILSVPSEYFPNEQNCKVCFSEFFLMHEKLKYINIVQQI